MCIIWPEPHCSCLSSARGHLKQDELTAVSTRVKPRGRWVCCCGVMVLVPFVKTWAGGRLLIPHFTWSWSTAAAHQFDTGLTDAEGVQVPSQQRGLKKLPEAFCQLETDVKHDFLILGQGEEFPGILSPCMISFQEHWNSPWSSEAYAQPASSACQSCKSHKEISACNLLFSFPFCYIKGILMISALF